MKKQDETTRLTKTVKDRQIQWYINQVLHPKMKQDIWTCWLYADKAKKVKIKKALIFLYGQTKKWDTIKCFLKKENAASTN